MSQSLSPGIDMIYRISPDGRYRYINKKAAEFLGGSPDVILGRHFLDFVREDFHQPILDFYGKQLKESQDSTYFEFPIPTLDGQVRWVGQSIELVFEDGELIELLGVAREITEQRATKERLKISDFQLLALVNNMDAAILVEDADRKLQYANQKFCDYFGIPAPPNELVGMDCAAAAEQSKDLFSDPSGFLDGIDKDLRNQVNHSGVRLELIDERVFERDYVPIFLEENQ